MDIMLPESILFNVIVFYLLCQITFHYMNIPQFIYPFSYHQHLDFSHTHTQTIMYNAMNILV